MFSEMFGAFIWFRLHQSVFVVDTDITFTTPIDIDNSHIIFLLKIELKHSADIFEC